MGAQTKQVGGGAATGVANNWNNFLNQQLMGTPSQQGTNASTMNLNGGQGGMVSFARDALANMNKQQLSNSQQPQQQSSAFRDAFSGALGGQLNDISGAGGAIQQYFQNQNNPFTNQYTAPEFQGANLSQLPTNFGQGQTGMADVSGFGTAAQTGFNPMQQLRDAGGSQFDSMLRQMIGGAGAQGGGFNPAGAGAGVQLAPGMSYQDAFGTVGQDPLMERNRMRQVADMRARFGAEGAGALGTGAQVAEGNLNAELTAQDASQRRAQAMALMDRDLANRMGGAQTALGSRGQDVQASIANMQGGLEGARNMIASNANALSALGQARGQDLNTQLGMRGQDLSQLGLGSQQGMFNTGQQNAMQQAMLQATLQNQGLGNAFGLGSAQLNNAAMQQNNANNMGMAGMQNQFNLSNAGNMANFGQAAQAGNANFLQNMINQGMGMNQLGNQNTMNMLNQMFGAMGQSNALGTPQAQIVQQPSGWGQALNAGLTLGGAFLGGPGGAAIGSSLGNMFGGGGGGGMGPLALPNNPMGGNLFGGANFGIGNQGGWGTNPLGSLDPRAIAADPTGFQRWLSGQR